MRSLYNCPNCGAPIQSEKCPYCGTTFYDFAAIDLDRPCYIKFKHKDSVITAKVSVPDITVTNVVHDSCPAYVDMMGRLHQGRCESHAEIDFHMIALGDVTVAKT